MKTYHYFDRRFLNDLVNFAAEDDAELSVRLMPDVPEFLDAWEIYRMWVGRISDADFIAIMDRHNIHRRYGLMHDYGIGGVIPKIEEIRLRDDKDIISRVQRERYFQSGLVREFYPPDAMFSGKRFRHVAYEDVTGPAILAVKDAVKTVIEEGYVVTNLQIGLSPHTVSGEYANYHACDAHLFAGNGEITVSGEDILAQRPDLLESIVRADGEIGKLPGVECIP